MKRYYDFQCPECGRKQEFFCKESEEVFCEKCMLLCKRIPSPVPSIVYQGKVGNYKNGYKSNKVNIRKT